MARIFGSLTVVLVLVAAACGNEDDASATSTRVGGAEAQRLVEEEGAVLLDVRTDGEWNAGHLTGATHIPVAELDARLAELPEGAKVVVYCQSGARSAVATEKLRAAGREAYDLGPMSAWPG